MTNAEKKRFELNKFNNEYQYLTPELFKVEIFANYKNSSLEKSFYNIFFGKLNTLNLQTLRQMRAGLMSFKPKNKELVIDLEDKFKLVENARKKLI
jgi:hypothetical protein